MQLTNTHCCHLQKSIRHFSQKQEGTHCKKTRKKEKPETKAATKKN
jgi:hypothetical protein